MKIGSNLSSSFFLKKKTKEKEKKERARRLENKNAFDTDVEETKAACDQHSL